MSKNNLVQTSKYLSLLLRHRPEEANLDMDKEGWVSVEQLLGNMKTKITFEELESIVTNNDKKRFTFNADKTKIRASQGHSEKVGVNLTLKKEIPPHVLYHGTAEKNIESIQKQGISKRSRMHVHLSSDYNTAVSVGQRYGKPVVLEVSAREMYTNGISFYLSDNGVYLTEFVDPKYIKQV